MNYYIIGNCKVDDPSYSGEMVIWCECQYTYSEGFYLIKNTDYIPDGMPSLFTILTFDLESGKRKVESFSEEKQIENRRLVTEEELRDILLIKDIIE